MKISFRRDAALNYMVIENVEKFSEDDFMVKMLRYNSIPQLLGTDHEYINGRVNLLYDISSKQTLLALLEAERLSYGMLKSFVLSVRALVESLGEYLLDVNNVILKKECIFEDLKSGKYMFCYDPYYNGDMKMELGMLFDEFLSVVDYEDAAAVKLLYDINRECHREGFTVDTLVDFAKEETPEQAEDFKEDMPPSAAQREPAQPQAGFEAETAFAAAYDDTFAPGVFRKLSSYFDSRAAAQPPEAGRESGRKNVPAKTDKAAGDNKKAAKRNNAGAGKDKNKEKHDLKNMMLNEPPVYKADRKDLSYRYGQEDDIDDLKFEEIRLNIPRAEGDDFCSTSVLNKAKKDTRRLVGLGRLKGRVVEVDTYPFTIGKLKEKVNSVCASPAVSRMHCRIHECGKGNYFFEDLNSRNGTYINNMRMEPYRRVPLHPGDIVTIADEEYAFR